MTEEELINNGYKFLHEGDVSEAKYYFEKVREVNTNSAEAYVGLGICHASSENFETATKMFKKAVELDPDHLIGNYNLGFVLSRRELDAEAEKYFRKAIEIDSNFSPVYFQLGILLYNETGAQSINEEAEMLFRKAIQLDPTDYLSWNALGLLLEKKGLTIEAENCYKQALKINPSDSRAYYNLGALLFKRGSIDEAISCLVKTVELDPQDFLAFYNLSVLFEQKKEFEGSKWCLLNAIRANPEYKVSYYNLGVQLEREELNDQAKWCYIKTIELDPEYYSAYNNLGNILLIENSLDEAMLCYNKTIEINSAIPDAYAGLALIHEKIDEFTKAEAYIKKAMEIDPENPGVFLVFGNILYNRGNQKEAYKNYLLAIKYGYDNPKYYHRIIQLELTINPNRQQHFYRFVYLSIKHKAFKLLSKHLDLLFEFDTPMLVSNIFASLPISTLTELANYSIKIQESIDKTKYFAWLIQIWRLEMNHPEASLLSEAIINYHFGDPISAYNIFNDEIDTEEIGLNLCAQYYFCLSAMEIMEEEEAIIEAAVKQADATLSGNQNVSTSEKYYGGLIYYLSGTYDKAISILHSLFPGFLPAGYKLAEIYEALSKRIDNEPLQKTTIFNKDYAKEKEKIIKAIRLEESHKPLYQFGIEIIKPSLEEEKFLEDIMPVLHFIEVQSTVAYIFVKSFDIRNAFYNAIQIVQEDNEKESLSLKNKAVKAWQQVIESELNEEELEGLFKGYSNFPNPAIHLGEFIQNGAKAELLDTKEKYRDQTQFNFKLYLALNYKLYQNAFISLEDASCINTYVYTCMESLPIFRTNDAKQYLLSCIRDYFLQENLPYFSYGQKLIALLEIIKTETKERKNPILSFNEFMSLYKAH